MSTKQVENVTIEKYSEKSFVVRGETKQHKEKLSDLGGKWNSRLRDGAGWIFPNMFKDNVQNWINNGIVIQKKKYNTSYNNETCTTSVTHNVGQILKEVSELKKEVSELKKLIKHLINNEEEIIVSDDDSEEEKEESEEEIIPKKRLLRRN
jgi:hypothetical protein